MVGRRTDPKVTFLLCAVVVVAGPGWRCSGTFAQDKPASTEAQTAAGDELTIDGVQARIGRFEENKDLDPAVKTRVLEACAKALEHLKAAADAQARSEHHAKLTREAPEALLTLRAQLALPASEQQPEVPADATLAQVQQLLSQAKTELSDVQKSLQMLQDEPKRRADRRLEIPKLADAARSELEEIKARLDAKPAPDEPADVTTASRLLLEARRQRLTAETASRQSELQFFESTGELLGAQRDQAARQVAEADNQVRALQAIVDERRRQEAERQALEARRTSARAQPTERKIAEATAELARKRQLLAGEIENTTREFERIDRQVKLLEEQFRKITNRYETAGATEAIGLLLRKQRADLPDGADHQREIRERAVRISATYLDLIDYEEQRNELATLDQRVRDIMRSLDTTMSEFEREYLQGEVRSVLEAQRNVCDSLIIDTNSYLEKLVEVDVRQRQFIATSEEYATYCDERILWIRSAAVLGGTHLRLIVPSLLWLASVDNWQLVGAALRDEASGNLLQTALLALVFLILFLIQRPLRTRTVQLGEQATRSSNTAYLPTLKVFLTAALMALLWPGLLGYVGLRLVASEGESEFVRAAGRGLEATALIFFTLELFRHVCRHRGLGEAHFDWDQKTMQLARSTTWWFMVCGLPLIFVVTMTEAQSSEATKNSLGRLAFVGSQVVLTMCVHRIMRPVGGALERIYTAAPLAWTSRLQHVWYFFSLSAPIMLGVLAIGGYYYTALQLAWRLLATWWLLLGLLIIHAALIRWSLLSYRGLAMKKARERRAAAEAAARSGGPSASSSATSGRSPEEVKLSDINKQTRKALQLVLAVGLIVGLWPVWGEILPALGALRHVELWMVEATDAEGATVTTVLKPITLASVLLAVVVASLTFTAGRNLPGLLEIAVLQRLPLDPGVRYAITSICQYAITATGLVTAFATIGIGWSKVQWLVAAISVGLGFGLQEIFANFVSGLILLFERPVRLGDIVTVGEVTGTVTRIQMRATTITDWDMRELVVPNREFITNRVMNWTLSSTVSRMSIAVGVAYGTNPDAVRNLLLKVARRHPLVLGKPEPHALLDQFGDSTLNFVLRVYMATRDVYLELRHTLLTDIASEFQKANIEIAFPQRDIHVRSFDAIPGKPSEGLAQPVTNAGGSPGFGPPGVSR